MANRINFYLGQLVTEADLDGVQENLQNSDRLIMRDQVYTGVVSNLGVNEHSGVPDLTVDVAGPGIAYDQEGRRVYVPSTVTLDCSVDSNGSATTVVGGGNEKYVSVFVQYDEILSNLQQDDNGTPVFVDITESYQMVVVQGSESAAGTAVRPSLLADGLLLADVLLAFGTTQIFDADIDSDDTASVTTRFAWMFNLTATSPAQVRARTLPAFAQDVLSELNTHIANLSNSHPLDAITFDNTLTPARFTATVAAVEAQEALDAVMVEIPQDATKSVLDMMTSPSQYASGASGVVVGLTCRGLGTLIVQVEAGSAIKYVSGEKANMWRLPTGTTIDLTGDPDGANPRWATIELDTITGTVVRTLGAAAATPVFPAGSADRIPLCYAYLTAASVAVVSGDLVDSRPLLVPDRHRSTVRFLEGRGGIEVGTVSSSVETTHLRGSWIDGSQFSTDGGDSFDLNATTSIWETGQSYGALGGASQILYLYGMRPEYPAGYDTDVDNVERVFAHSGTRIPGALGNMILTVSTSTVPGAAAAGNPGAITTNSALWPALGSGVYLGSCAYIDGSGNLGTQVVTEGVVTHTTAPTLRSDTTNVATTAVIDVEYDTPFAGNIDQIYPSFASAWLLGAQFDPDGPNVSRIFFQDTRSTELYWDSNRAGGGELEDQATQFWMWGTSSISHTLTFGGGLHTVSLWVNSYRDGILCMR